jgi:hypothetical protein
MTLLRKLALKISNEVVIWASPGSKEWAEGLAREVPFIMSDWAALRWSLGSIRVVFDRREVPIASLEEVPAQFQKFVDRFIYGALGLWFPIFRGPQSAFEFFYGGSELRRFGSAFVVLASLSGLIYWLFERYRLKRQLTDDILDSAVDSALCYKAALRRQCSAIWIPAFAFSSFAVGIVLEQGGLRAVPFFGSLLIILGICYVLGLRMIQRVCERRIERLDVLLSERSGAVSTDGMS